MLPKILKCRSFPFNNTFRINHALWVKIHLISFQLIQPVIKFEEGHYKTLTYYKYGFFGVCVR